MLNLKQSRYKDSPMYCAPASSHHMNPQVSDGLEVWGGAECTVNRIGDRFFDQIRRSGHESRIEDLDRFASLGLSSLRYPVLWERTADAAVTTFDWAWADERLSRLRELGMAPIVGLVHHGSGPEGTSLLDRSFSEGLARYAGAVAARYPWVKRFTPVNEPLTTARFSALYGHWYPHQSDGLAFARAFLEQCRGVVQAMRAIRRIIPDAELVQTEDLGKTHSTPKLRYQAEFENERRWLTWDVLSGRLSEGHPMWDYFRWLGVDKSELAWFLENTCPPDIIGVNHYLTSERFLDDRVDLYPPELRGGNGRDSYVDVEAVRVLADGADGPEQILRAAWERYGIPIAVTEAHNGCTREEQLRWMLEIWDAAVRLRNQGYGDSGGDRVGAAWRIRLECTRDLRTRSLRTGRLRPSLAGASAHCSCPACAATCPRCASESCDLRGAGLVAATRAADLRFRVSGCNAADASGFH